MSPKRLSYIMIGVVILLLIGIFAAVAGGDLLFKKQSEKLSSLKAQDQVIKEQEVSLAQAKSDIEKYTPLDEIAKSIVPQDKDQAKTIREINAIAASSGVKLQQISFDTSTLGQAPVSTKSASDDSDGGSASGTSTPSAPSISQVKPVQGISGVYSLEITVSSGDANPVSYYKFLNFLQRLEANRRTAHVNSINVTPSEKDRSKVTFSLVLNAYLKP